MRVLAVVALASPHGEYGGPLRVAVNQLAALRDRGHEVLLLAAHRGYGAAVPTVIDSVPVRLYRSLPLMQDLGFAGLAAPGLWWALWRRARSFDVVHIHLGRDMVTLPAARIAQARGVPTVVQPHGMIDASANPLAIPLDAAFTRPALRAARRIAYLTPAERADIEDVTRGEGTFAELGNGVPLASVAENPGGTPAHVLFLARLAPRKRPATFVEAATIVAKEFTDARFTLVGPDEGEGEAVRAAIAASGVRERIEWLGPAAPDRTIDIMRSATAYVLPSIDEPYGMTVLEAMSVGLPVIVTDSCGLASFVTRSDAGTVVDASVESLAAALRALISEPERARAQGANGYAAVRAEHSMTAIAARLEGLYTS